MQIINQYQDGEYTVTEYESGLIERRLPYAIQSNAETKHITKLALKNRFPRAKWIAARTASAASPALADFFESFDLATYIDLEDPELIVAVNKFSAPATPVEMRLTTEEVDAVLSYSISDKEAFI